MWNWGGFRATPPRSGILVFRYFEFRRQLFCLSLRFPLFHMSEINSAKSEARS